MAVRPGPIGYAPSDRGHVAHQVTGTDGPYVVLLPTLTASFVDYWDLPEAVEVLERLTTHCRLVVLDRRGTGSSDPLQPDETADARVHAHDVAAVLAHLGVTDAMVIGESYAGGPAALRAAAAAPDRISRVVVANLPLTPVTAQLGVDRERVVEAVLWGSDDGGQPALNPSVDGDAAYAAWAERAGRATSPAVARAMWEAMLDYDLGDVVTRVTQPVTVISTGHWAAPAAGAAALADALPDATIVEVPRDDSLLFLGDNDDLVTEFLHIATGQRVRGPLRRRLLAVLFTDLADSTQQAAALGDATWRGRLDAHDRLSLAIVEQHGGTLVKQTGDGVLATFPLGSSAVTCAIDLLARLEEAGLTARAGVHVGEVELRGDDLGGLAVHVAARVMATAGAGEVVVSDAVRATTLGSGHGYGPTSSHELRGVPGTWDLAVVVD